MARLYTDTPFSGTFGNLTVYRVGDKCYARTKSSLERKRFQKDPAFAKAREKAVLFGAAARLVKVFYGELPEEVKCHGLFGKLTAIAYKGLQEEQNSEAIKQELRVYCRVEKKEVVVNDSLRVPKTASCLHTGELGIKSWLSKWKVTVKGKLELCKEDNGTMVGVLPQSSSCSMAILPDG